VEDLIKKEINIKLNMFHITLI